jgi:hypothetical protein
MARADGARPAKWPSAREEIGIILTSIAREVGGGRRQEQRTCGDPGPSRAACRKGRRKGLNLFDQRHRDEPDGRRRNPYSYGDHLSLGTVRELLLQSFGFWADRIIPFAVEVMPDDVDGCEFVVGDLNASGVHRGIESAADFEAGLRRRRSDQLDDHLMTDERLATPVAGDE